MKSFAIRYNNKYGTFIIYFASFYDNNIHNRIFAASIIKLMSPDDL